MIINMKEIIFFLRTKIIELSGDETLVLDENTPFDELSMNSVSFVRLILRIEQNYEIEFEDEMLGAEKYQTLYDLYKYIEDKIQEKV